MAKPNEPNLRPTLHYDASYWINGLDLIPHPEGGFYRQTYRSPEVLPSLHEGNSRSLSTSIYFLLTRDNVSHLHRLKSDEIWYYHAGSPLTVYVIHENGELEHLVLGLDLAHGQVPQVTVPKGCIFGSALTSSHTDQVDYALVGCMVSPGFEFADFELFTRDELLQAFPTHRETIEMLTPNP